MSAIKTSVLTERSFYGLIVTATLLISLENHEQSSWDMALTILLTLLSIALAERYASVFARGLDENRNTSLGEFRDLVRYYIQMVYGGLTSVVLFIIAGLGYLKLPAAFNIAELFVGLLLIVYGYIYGRKKGRSKLASLLYGMANFSIVALIVLFKSLFHV